MTTVILTIHVLIVLALIAIVLLQRSEGGALGMGGGGSGGGFMTGRGAANALTRTTSILAACFFATSITLAVIADRGESDEELIRDLTGEEVGSPDGTRSVDDITRALGRSDDEEAPSSEPASPLDALGDALNAPSAPDATPVDAAPVDGDGAQPEALSASEGSSEQEASGDSETQAADPATEDAPQDAGADGAPQNDQ